MVIQKENINRDTIGDTPKWERQNAPELKPTKEAVNKALYTPLGQQRPSAEEVERAYADAAKKTPPVAATSLPAYEKKEKVLTSIRFDKDIMDWLRSMNFWQPRLNQLLRNIMEAEQHEKDKD